MFGLQKFLGGLLGVETDDLLGHSIMPPPPGTERFGFHDDQIDVRIFPLVAPTAGAEKDHLLGIDFGDDGLDHLLNECVGDLGHGRCRIHQMRLTPARSKSVSNDAKAKRAIARHRERGVAIDMLFDLING